MLMGNDIKKIWKIPSKEEIQIIHKAIRPFIFRTPVISSSSINQRLGVEIFFKCENFQKTGSFKMRGASSAMLALTKEDKIKGVATHSSGNHAQALAQNAKHLNTKAYIVMPRKAPSIKRKAVENLGYKIVNCESNIISRQSKLNQIIDQTDAIYIPSSDDYNVIAGQATCTKELLEKVESLDVLIVPVGGGGLLSGTALSAHYLNPNIKVIGAEPYTVDDAYRSLHSGKIKRNESFNSIADGLFPSLSNKTFKIIQNHVEEIIRVSEKGIIDAMSFIWEHLNLLIEPSSAVAFAAIFQQRKRFSGKKIGLIISGGNVDLNILPYHSFVFCDNNIKTLNINQDGNTSKNEQNIRF